MKNDSEGNFQILATPKGLWFPVLAAVLLAAPLCPAAVITWGSNTQVASTADVSTTGTLVEAFNLGYKDDVADNVDTVTVNSVTFTRLVRPAPLTSVFTTAYTQLDSNTTGNADYNNLLNTVAIGGGADLVSMTLGGGNLINGLQYQIQVWYVEERATFDSRVMQYGDGNGNTVDVGGSGGTLGHYAIGTFTANGTTQTLTMDPQGFGNSHLNAYQIRLIPEPSSAMLIGLTGGLLLLRRRRR